jgi:hypothetical protein
MTSCFIERQNWTLYWLRMTLTCWKSENNLARTGIAFSGVIYAHPLNITVGVLIENLNLVAGAMPAQELASSILYLPI